MRTFIKEQPPVSTAPAAEPATPPPGGWPQAASPPVTAVAIAPRHGAYIEGDLDKSDVKTPYLSCVQSVGPKSLLFTPGTLVLGEVPVTVAPVPPATATGRLRVLFMNAKKVFVENLPYNQTQVPGAPRARIFNTLAEVHAVGGWTEWRGNIAPSFLPKTTCFALIRCPAGLEDSQFCFIDGTNTYAPGLVSFQKTSYPAAKTLWTDLSLSLKGDPTTTFYDLYWSREQRGPNWVWIAKLIRARDEKPSAELTAQARKLSGGAVSFDETGDE